ncbi:1,6-dihydroxycyclohexa-2,4-diene-1-carboxylate dehydrogenase [Allosaccharopolyspora coralli]|uniref:1,6-dihydroxycyclohexa-2,4-diene-1-carboxylate dehydrogenase n=1 Tax=Allosaccharopolyspora coralli TaxID=2665642 RepID=A0A5Q3Q3Q5_9PSEU|nr:benzoate 1,2-dioxygenase electron transfer component BenC [Allosaccharopolyspora coralli]QGK69248.1 1,6-dihydroxycyclohexa-2,4-diene-1-carboxylate dehydrogenase [Allosaccharopolyspora coralli]
MSQHQVALAFEDGVTRFISCEDDQTVADASYRSRINIPLDCRDGACGTCKAFCESGNFWGGDYIDDALADDEAQRGYVLPCSMTPKSDLVLRIASTSAVAKTQPTTYTGTLAHVTRLSSTTYSVGIEIPNRDELAYLPGQYVNIAVPGTDESRSYSFSNAPDEHTLTFLVKLSPGGVMSTYLTERARVGDEISFTGPHGSFFLRETERPALLVAGGTGLAPIMSILRKLRADNTTRPVHVLYGVSTDEDLVELDTVDGLTSEIGAVGWEHCVADPQSSAANKGFVTSLLRAEQVYDGDVDVYLCGPPPMVEAVREHFSTEGIEPVGFYYEKFALSGTAADSGAPSAQADASAPAEPQPEVAAVPAPPEPEPAVPEDPAPVEPAVPDTPATLTTDETDAVPTEEVPTPVPQARSIAGQVVSPRADVQPLHAANGAPSTEREAATARAIAGQPITRASGDGPTADVGTGEGLLPAPGARSVAGQQILPDAEIEPLVRRPAQSPTPVPASTPAQPSTPTVAVGAAGQHNGGGYVIGEEHPSVHHSDAIFEAREALELGALELTIGRLSSQDLAGYRLLAESTVPYVEGDRFTDAAAYTETNAAFHDYLFTLTGNDHLLQAYQNLGVKGRMQEVLRHATWCDPSVAQDHLDIVEAFESGDRERARTLVVEHAERSKRTMRRAMDDTRAQVLPDRYYPGRFEGKVVVVTGAAQGIGQAVARRVAAEGGTVALVDRAEMIEDEASLLCAAGTRAAPVLADLETWSGATKTVENTLERFGRIDVLINNVGGAIAFKPFEEFGDDEIQAEITRSLMPTLWCSRAVLPAMIEAGGGTIVNVSSNATRGIHRVPYSAAKGGVNAITSALAMEAAPHGIRVAGTAPGGTEAPERRIPRGPARDEREEGWFQQTYDQVVDSTFQKRYGTLDEQAAAITFVASDEASYITGSVLPVAGGDLG